MGVSNPELISVLLGQDPVIRVAFLEQLQGASASHSRQLGQASGLAALEKQVLVRD